MAKDKPCKDKHNNNFLESHHHHHLLWWTCADMKLLISSLFILCTIATIVQLFPSFSNGFLPSNFTSCFSKLTVLSLNNLSTDSHQFKQEELVSNSVIKRAFNPIGSAAYLFVQMGAYRGGANNFAVVGLASKPLHVFAKPEFQCEWQPHSKISNENSSVMASGFKILPDWGYGRVYTVVVVNCTFPVDVGSDGAGGRLIIHASTGGGGDKDFDIVEKFTAIEEDPGTVNMTIFSAKPKYDYLYCGSSLYGNLSPQRIREWIAYHVKLFGPKAHFVIHDAGGVHPAVMEVLKPWIELGVVTLQDIRDQERFDGYYHNQFMVVNDCLLRYKFMAKWIFFFDVDEFIYLRPKMTVDSLMGSLSNYSQFTIEQMPMSSQICQQRDYGKNPRMWGMEKLAYRDVKKVARRDRKYAIQPRYAFATGVHMSQNVAGQTLHKLDGKIKYFHYHGTISNRREPCKVFFNTTAVTYEGTPYVLDETLRRIAGQIKMFEVKMIGSRLEGTRQ